MFPHCTSTPQPHTNSQQILKSSECAFNKLYFLLSIFIEHQTRLQIKLQLHVYILVYTLYLSYDGCFLHLIFNLLTNNLFHTYIYHNSCLLLYYCIMFIIVLGIFHSILFHCLTNYIMIQIKHICKA